MDKLDKKLRAQRGTLMAVSLGIAGIPITVALTGVALDPLRRDLGADLRTLQWVMNAFLLAYAALPIPLGSIADRRGRRRIFVLGVAGFVLMPLLCALSPSISWLIAARFGQGVAAALIGASSLALLAEAFPELKERKAAFGVMGLAIGISLAIGGAGGGAVIDLVGWRWAFALQAAIGLLPALFLRDVPESVDPSGHPIDVAGSFAGFLALAFWISFGIFGPEIGWSAPPTLGLFAGAVAMSLALVAIERRAVAPMIERSLVTNRGFAQATLVCLVFTGALVAVLYFVPLHLQAARGYSSTQTGILLLTMLIPMAIWPVIVSRVARSVPIFLTLATGMMIMAVGLLTLGHALAGSGGIQLMIGLAVFGTGCGFVSGLVDAAALSALPPHQSGIGTGVFDSLRVVGNSAGAILSGIILTAAITAGMGQGIENPAVAAGAIIAGNQTGSGEIASYRLAMETLMCVLAGITASTAIFCLLLQRHARKAETPDPMPIQP